MAVRRASLSMLRALQLQGAGAGVRPAAACMQFTTPSSRADSMASFMPDVRSGRNAPGRSFTQQLHSMNQAKGDDHETFATNEDHGTFEFEKGKMQSEGGHADEKSFHEKSAEILQAKAEKISGSDDVKEKTEEAADTVKEKTEEAAGTVKEKTEDAAGTAKEEAKGMTEQVSETATGLKEVGVEAGKAVVRDAGKVAEKVGLKSETK